MSVTPAIAAATQPTQHPRADRPRMGRLEVLYMRLFAVWLMASLVIIPIIGIVQLAAVNEGLQHFGLPFWIAVLLGPPIGFIPLLGTAVGTFGAIDWHVHPIVAIAAMLLPGRRQFIMLVFSRWRG